MINNIIKFLKHRWQAKLGSLIVAILFYFYVQYAKTISKTFYIKVEPPVLPNHLIFKEEPPPFIKVEFSGPEELLEIDPSNFKLYMINTGPTAGPNKFRLELNPPPPPSIQAQIEKTEIEIQLDNKKRKALPLVLVYELPANKNLAYWNINPQAIIIEGPESIINSQYNIKLNPVKLSPTSSLFYDKVMIQALPKFTKLVENQPFEIQLELKYYSEEEFQSKLKDLPPGFYFFEEEIPISCKNNIGRLEVTNDPKIKVFYISKYYLTSTSFIAEVFCPVELDTTTNSIKPSTYIPDLPVIVKTKYEVKELEIIKVEPLQIGLQFRIKKKIPMNQLEKGLQEHLIR
ncbi:MAG: hypothetical protein KatS3mg129_2444 [Leptospiraceae bacterium]|nr:MAG: hypothetical protein KatS3mg129_2444 [Leptospiraceae bacterium]